MWALSRPLLKMDLEPYMKVKNYSIIKNSLKFSENEVDI